MSANPLHSTHHRPAGNAAHEEASRRALIAETKAINTKGHDVLDAESRVVTTAVDLKNHEETSPELVQVHSSIVTMYYIYLFGLVCVYGLDLLLFGATAEYAVGLITGNPVLVVVGKYGIPLFFLGVECWCALNMHKAWTKRSSEEAPTYGW